MEAEMKKNLVVAAVVAVLGLMMTACGGGSDSTAAAPEPKVVVKTETVTKEVKVPVVPQACKDAISAAEDMGRASHDFAGTASGYPPLIGKAFGAGLKGDVGTAQRILDRMRVLNGELHGEVGQVSEVVDRFNEAKVKCLAGDQQS
jgi:uncharacterized protein YcfJ